MAESQVSGAYLFGACVSYYDLDFSWYGYPSPGKMGGADEVVPGDGLYEKALKKEAEEGTALEKAGPIEQDAVTPMVA